MQYVKWKSLNGLLLDLLRQGLSEKLISGVEFSQAIDFMHNCRCKLKTCETNCPNHERRHIFTKEKSLKDPQLLGEGPRETQETQGMVKTAPTHMFGRRGTGTRPLSLSSASKAWRPLEIGRWVAVSPNLTTAHDLYSHAQRQPRPTTRVSPSHGGFIHLPSEAWVEAQGWRPKCPHLFKI